MDWTEKTEQKKRLRKMAGRMLWADFKGTMCGWQCIFVAAVYFFFFLLPYVRNTDDFNGFAMSYAVLCELISVGALYEKSFNYLPLSTEEIVYYLKYRTNLLTAWMVVISVVSGAVLYAAGEELFVERGLMMLCFLLMAQEGWFFELLYSYGKAQNAAAEKTGVPKARRVRIVLYSIYTLAVILASMLVWMFMDYNENAKIKLLFVLGAYLVMYIFRADVSRWVQFKEYTKASARTVLATQQQQNPQN